MTLLQQAAADSLMRGVAELAQDLGAISTFVVGSFATPTRRERRNGDLDLRIVLGSVTREAQAAFVDSMSGLVNALDTESMRVGHDCTVGIARLHADVPTLLAHAFLLTPADLLALPRTHLRGYASRYLTVQGEDALSPFTKVSITPEAVLNESEGVNHCIRMIDAWELDALDWSFDGGMAELVVHRRALDCTWERWELLLYSYDNANRNASIACPSEDLSSLIAASSLEAWVVHLRAYERMGPAARRLQSACMIDEARAGTLAHLSKVARILEEGCKYG